MDRRVASGAAAAWDMGLCAYHEKGLCATQSRAAGMGASYDHRAMSVTKKLAIGKLPIIRTGQQAPYGRIIYFHRRIPERMSTREAH